jgi:DNA-directed RNA polymerase specialized sigma24 family protein
VIEINELMEEQLLTLPASERAAFRHYAINGHSAIESCLTFGIPATTLKSRILRTRRKLAHGMQYSLDKAGATSPEGKSVRGTQR